MNRQRLSTRARASTAVILVMGVSGSGKTTIGQALAHHLGAPFFDADHFHPRANIMKMARGEALSDADRQPWLRTLRGMIEGWLAVNASAILACSALKRQYRQMLIQPGEPVRVVYLRGTFERIEQRMQGRSHFFKPHMLRTQFEALEEPNDEEAIVLDIDRPPAELVATILRQLGR